MAQTFKNARAVLADTATTVYTCPAGTTAIVIGAQVANVSTDIEVLNFSWIDSSDSNVETYLVEEINVPPTAAFEPIAGKLVLEAGDSLQGSGVVASALEVTVSVLEIS